MGKPKLDAAEQVRQAAELGRQRQAELRSQRLEGNIEGIDAFAVRCAGGFTWEVRRFGGLVVAQSEDCFVTAEKARAAGQATLDWLVGSGWTSQN